MGKYLLEFTDHEDPREKSGWCDSVESDTPIPIPGVGDRVAMLEHGLLLEVVRRLFYFSENLYHVQVFCRKIAGDD